MSRSRAGFLSQQWAWVAVALLLSLGLTAPAAAQGERGVIGGTVADAQGKPIVTLEGLGTPEKPHPLQKLFLVILKKVTLLTVHI